MVANLQNLKVPTSEEARENGRKGGLASGVARRKKKEDIKTAKTIVEELFKHKHKLKGSNKQLTAKEIMLKKVFEKAIKDGSLSAVQMLLSIVGENPNNLQINATGFNIVVADDRAKEALEDL